MHSSVTKTYILSMRGLYLMIRRLTRMMRDVFSLSGLYIGLTTVGILAGLEIYLGLSNSVWRGLGLLMLPTVIFLLTRQWQDGENKSHKKLEIQESAVHLWDGDDASWEILCQHCAKRTIIQCKVV